MSIDVSSLQFSVAEPVKKSRTATATVVTDELLDTIIENMDQMVPADDYDNVFIVPIDRPTPGSAQGLGNKIMRALTDQKNYPVVSSPQPVNPEAWKALTDGKRSSEVLEVVRKITESGSAKDREAIHMYPAFRRVRP